MENELKINAEFVNELEFVNGREYGPNRSNRITPHTDDFEAVVLARVGKVEEKVTLSVGRVYVYTNGKYQDYFGFNPRNEKPFADLSKAGIEVNFDSIFKQYASMLKKERHTDKLRARLSEIEKVSVAKKEYDESWIHTLPELLKTNKNKRVQRLASGATFKPMAREVYLKNRGTLSLEVTYAGFSTLMYNENGSFIFNGDKVFEFPKDYDDATDQRRNHSRKIADGKIRRAKAEATIFLKFVDAVDLYIAQRIRSVESKKSADAKREDVRLYLEDKAGRPVKLSSEEKYVHPDRYSGRRNGFYQTIYTYRVGGMKINTDFSKEYLGDGKYSEEKRTFSIKGLNELDEVQFKGILDLLIK
jgi:hypothetical protein